MNDHPLLTGFANSDVAGATAWIEAHPDEAEPPAYEAHPLLQKFVETNHGRLHQKAHLEIADLLTSELVCAFRDSVIAYQVDEITQWLCQDPGLTKAEFAAGRGIGNAMHHWKSIEMAEGLLQVGAEIDTLNSLNETPLTVQLRFGSIEASRFLLEKGANPNLGASAHLPSDSMQARIELLLANGWDIDRGHLLHDANHGHGTRIQSWLRNGADPTVADANGQTPLHLLAARGKGREAIRALAEAGADLEAKDLSGKTPLDLALTANEQAAAETLKSLHNTG